MDGIIVIGTGRSGTSLTMQALEALGARIADKRVPPSENNLRGTGEAVEVRDQMVGLDAALGHIAGFRPAGWDSHARSVKTQKWIATYLKEQTKRSMTAPFAVKLPLISIFLPMWINAATDTGVSIRFIWSTRRASDTIGSLISTYGSHQKAASLSYAQRCYYILRDAPLDTLLMPYEGWSKNASTQVAALAEALGVKDCALMDTALETFNARLNHAKTAPILDLPASINNVDRLISDKCERLSAIFDRNRLDHVEMLSALSDQIAQWAVRGEMGLSDDEFEMRLKLLELSSEQMGKEDPKMQDEIEILTKRIREVSQENRNLSSALAKTKKGDFANEKTAELARLRDSDASKTAELAELRDSDASKAAELAKLRESYASLAAARDRQEEEIASKMRNKIQDLERRLSQQNRRIQSMDKRLNKRKFIYKTLITYFSKSNWPKNSISARMMKSMFRR